MGYGCGLVFGLVIGCVVFITQKPKWFVRIVEEEIQKKVKKSARSHKRPGPRKKLEEIEISFFQVRWCTAFWVICSTNFTYHLYHLICEINN